MLRLDLPATSCGGHSEGLRVQLALLAPIVLLVLAAILGSLARDVVEERFGLVVAHSNIILLRLVLSSAGLVARIILLVGLAIQLQADDANSE